MEGYDYAKCIDISKQVRWDMDKDVIRGREFDLLHKFLPDGISKVDDLDFLNEEERNSLSQVQGRTYSNMFGFVERFIVAKILEVTRGHWLGDQIALEALVRFCDEELKHQRLFRRIEPMLAAGMPDGYTFPHQPDAVAAAVLQKSTWAVLVLILEIELFTQEHYRHSIEPNENLSPLFKDIFLFHMKEETTHALMDELELLREDKKLTPMERDRAVDELIELVGAVDGLLQAQSKADVDYFLKVRNPLLEKGQIDRIREGVLKAYRWQYIFSGAEHPRFTKVLGGLITENQGKRINNALGLIR
jgi:hypothetical protein